MAAPILTTFSAYRNRIVLDYRNVATRRVSALERGRQVFRQQNEYVRVADPEAFWQSLAELFPLVWVYGRESFRSGGLQQELR